MKALPIRWRITTWSAAITTGVLLVFATGTLLNVYHEEIETVDRELHEDARETMAALDAGRTLADLVDEPPQKSFALVDRDGSILQVSPTFPESLKPFLSGGSNHQQATRYHRTHSWRMFAAAWQDDRLWVAEDLAEVHETLWELLAAYLFALPFAVGLAAWGAWVVAGRSLAPVHSAAQAAARISGQGLDRRLPQPPTQDEIGHLTLVLNQMLDRIERSYRQAERFAADASHELRTPLTIMRGEIEQLLQSPAIDENLEDKLHSLKEEIDRLEGITEHLLLLAKFDAGQVVVNLEAIDFSALVTEVCEDIEILADAMHLRFQHEIQPRISLRCDAWLMRQLLLNLLDNAARHNLPGGWIRCVLQSQGASVNVRVVNSSQKISAEQRDRLFERFYRADPANSPKGHGLGLSLCREIVRLHQGSLELRPDSGEHLRSILLASKTGIGGTGSARSANRLEISAFRPDDAEVVPPTNQGEVTVFVATFPVT